MKNKYVKGRNSGVLSPRWGGYATLIILFLTSLFVFLIQPVAVHAGGSWFSKVRHVGPDGEAISPAEVGATSSISVFDVTISLYNDPLGDNDPNVDQSWEIQKLYEEIIRYWADAVYEQTNGAHRLGKVRIFRNGIFSSLADVKWDENISWPCADLSGFGFAGNHIFFGDKSPNTIPQKFDGNWLNSPELAGYAIGHEWGHYVYKLFDEYQSKNKKNDNFFWMPHTDDSIVVPSIMSSFWNFIDSNSSSKGIYHWLNHSTLNNYEINTAQARVYGKSGWDILTKDPEKDHPWGERRISLERIHYTNLDNVKPKAADNWIKIELPGEQTEARSQLEIIWMDVNLEMQIVLDRSGSMAGSKIANAKEAAKNLVDVSQNGRTSIGVISFSTEEFQTVPITKIPVDGVSTKNTIKNDIDGITAQGWTSMYDAAEMALENLKNYKEMHRTNARQIVFLLSDGEDNYSTTTKETLIEQYKDEDVPLITFGYGYTNPNLRDLSQDTGGLYLSSPTTLAEIQKAFLAANAIFTSTINISSSSVTLTKTGQTYEETFSVDNTIESFSVLSLCRSWYPLNVDFTLMGPTGTVPGINFECEDVPYSYWEKSCIANVDKTTVSLFGTGEWSVKANYYGERYISPDVNLDITVTGQPISQVRTYELTVTSLGGETISYPNPVLITATVSKGLPITGVNLTAMVTDPSSIKTDISLNDRGEDGDAIAGDGTYSAIMDYEKNGTYDIAVNIDNDSGTAHFTIEGLPGGMAVTQDFPPINENFMRTASLQITVEGVRWDDHLDRMPGTSISADNSHMPGKIDFAGDLDLFRIGGINTGEDLVIRVFNFALGMDPVLTVYESDGKTVAASGDLSDAQSKNGYVYTTISAGSLDSSGEMYASVEHTDSSASQGFYEISAGSALTSDQPPPTPEPVSAGGGGGGCSIIGVKLNFLYISTGYGILFIVLSGLVIARRRLRKK